MTALKSLVLVVAVAAGAATAAAARADSRVELGVTAWDAQASGNIHSTDPSSPNTPVDLENDLAMGRHANGGVHLVLRSGLPFLPDLRLQYDHVMSDGDTRLNKDVVWGGTIYTAKGRVKSQAELKSGRVVFFWNPLDNPAVNLRLGVEARWFSINVPLSGTAVRTNPPTPSFQASTSGGGVSWLPMANAGLTVHLPAGFDLVGEGSYTRYSGSYAYDARAGVKYHADFGLVVSAGWRRLRLHLDDTSFSVNGTVNFSGPYASVGFAF